MAVKCLVCGEQSQRHVLKADSQVFPLCLIHRSTVDKILNIMVKEFKHRDQTAGDITEAIELARSYVKCPYDLDRRLEIFKTKKEQVLAYAHSVRL